MPAGRPPILAAEKQLLRELRHLTGCRIEGIIDVLENLGYPRSLPKRAGVRQWVRQSGRTIEAQKDLTLANVRSLRLRVIPIRGEGGRRYEIALLWEPVTRVLLGQVKASFVDDLEAYLTRAWGKLPPSLTAQISQMIICRSGHLEGENFWYASARKIVGTEVGRKIFELTEIEENSDKCFRIDLQQICENHADGAAGFVKSMLNRYMRFGVNSHAHNDLDCVWQSNLSPLYRAMWLASRSERQGAKRALQSGFGYQN